MHVDLLIHSAAQLLTLASAGPKRGAAMEDLGIIENGAVAIKDGLIALVGPTAEVRGQVTAAVEIDATGKVVMPGFVDPHTHLVFAGHRADEFELRIKGATYLEIMAAGGGIMSTVRATRAASVGQLVEESRARLDRMLAHGTTTAEVKTGYGLDTENELKMLEAIHRLDAEHPVDLVPTFLGAHAVPEEYEGRADEYVDMVVEEMLPRVRDKGSGARDKAVPSPLSLVTGHSLPFCDVFCDEGAFTL
ncbi:MAG: amidohydrolase family protein, partial [Chloroflexi bacterium]|nr:amidohydrolase family protein [Chloroflexota bacterium]